MDVTLVTGATGFLGTSLVRALHAGGHRIRVMVRQPERLDRLGPSAADLEVVRGNLIDPESVSEAMKGVRFVYHAAAFVGFGGPDDIGALMDVNVGGTRAVVNAALEQGVERLVHTSSIAALGRPEISVGCLDETAVWTESRLNTAYARSKHLAELEIHRGIAEGLDAVLVNPSLMMGPGRKGENTMQIVQKVKEGRLPAIPAGATNVVDVDDVAQGHLAAMDRGVTGHRYVLAGENLPWTEILGTLGKALDVPVPTRTISLRSALVLGLLSETLAKVSGRKALITRETARASGHRTCYDNSRAVTELGVSFRPFAETAVRIAESLQTPSSSHA